MNVDDFLNGDQIPKLNIDKDKLLQVLLLKALHNDVKLDAILIKLSEIKAKLNGIEESKLNGAIDFDLKEITDTIDEAFSEKYAAVLKAISSD